MKAATEVRDLAEFLVEIRNHPNWDGSGWFYRGQARSVWDLRPKAGRGDYFNESWERQRTVVLIAENDSRLASYDIDRFHAWRNMAVAYTDKLPENDFECLAYAQHYGLATRLLDWTANPLCALYFAVETYPEDDGAVWLHSPRKIITEFSATVTLDNVEEVFLYRPRPFDRRILAQDGVFTYHPNPSVPIALTNVLSESGGNLVKLAIPARSKSELQRQLADISITRKSLFPDLEGLSGFINWRTRQAVSATTKLQQTLKTADSEIADSGPIHSAPVS